MSSFAKDLFAVIKSRGTVIFCGIFTSIITARYLGPEGNGIISAVTVYPSLVMIVGSLGIRQSTAYFVGQKKYSDDDIFSSVLFVWMFTSVICVAACYVLLEYFSKSNFNEKYVFLAVLPIPFSLFTTYASGLFLGRNNIKDFNTVNWVPNVVKLISYVLLIIIIPWDITGALVGIVTGYILLCFFVWRKVRKMVKIAFTYNKVIIKQMLGLGSVYAISLLLSTLNYKLDIAFLEHLSTKYEIGIYTKGVSIVEYLWEIPTLISTIIFARSSTAKDGRAFSYKVCQLLRVCFVSIGFLSVLFFFLSTFIMVFMYGEKFRASSEVQKLLLPGILLLTVFKVLNMDLAGKGKPWIAIYGMLPSLAINMVLNYLWDAKYGANGAAVASTISYSVSAVIFLFMYCRTVDIPLKDVISFSKNDFDFVQPLIKKLSGGKLKNNAA